MRMSDVEFLLRGFRDPRLAAHAIGALPAWLWAPDGSRLLWTNAAGAAILGCTSCTAAPDLEIGPADPHRLQIARLAGRLHQSGKPHLERLRGFGAPLGRLLTCSCARLDLGDGKVGILIAAAEPVGRAPAAEDRLRRLVEGLDSPVAIFHADGSLCAATPAAAAIIGEEASLVALGIEALRRDVLDAGRAEFASARGRFVLHRLGAGTEIAIAALLTPPAVSQPEPEAIGEPVAPASVQASPSPLEGTPAAIAGAPGDQMPPGSFVDILARSIDAAHAAPRTANDRGGEIVRLPEPAATLPSPGEPPDELEPARAKARPPSPEPPIAEALEETPLAVRRQPLRFMWQMDADGHFSLGSDEFSRLIGPRTAAALGRPWSEINAAFGLDPEDRVAAAIASRDTWSNIAVAWPVDDSGARLEVELSGLPVFDRAHHYIGYRGFGVCRDIDSLERLATLRRQDRLVASTIPVSRDDAEDKPVPPRRPREAEIDEPPPNVVPFRPLGETKPPVLTSIENHAFNEIARQISARLNSDTIDEPPAADTAPVAESTKPAEIPYVPPRPPSFEVERPLLDRLPIGVLIYRLDRLIYANRAFLDRTGYSDLSALVDAGGLDALYVEPVASAAGSMTQAGTQLVISSSREHREPVDARLYTIPWEEGTALALIFSSAAAALPATPPASAPVPAVDESSEAEIAELRAALGAARERLDRAAINRSDVMTRISHEIRTPMNAIIGFAEVMIDERFGAIGNERYGEYLKDIRACGERVIALIDDMLDLSRVETGKLDLAFANVALNDLVEQCVAMMQPQANRERIIIRTSLASSLPPVVADGRTLRQIVINLISNAIRLANAGGQVIVSTALSDGGGVALRIRDTGPGMSETEIAAALEPFRAITPDDQGAAAGAGLNLSLTKALVEANRAQFAIKSSPNAGTLAEITFTSMAQN
jgi:signal transduction histidine kinase